MNNFEAFDSREALFDEAARSIAKTLREVAADKGRAGFVASGGNTPKPVYERLCAETSVPWEKVSVTLTDERRAPPEAGVDNEGMVRRTLIRGAGRFATFVPMDREECLDGFPDPFACVLMGMGGDGHFASIFPGGENMVDAMFNREKRVIGTTPAPLPPEAPYPRWTITAPALCRTRSMILLITGDNKKQKLEEAMGDGPAEELPVRYLLREQGLPLRILWAA